MLIDEPSILSDAADPILAHITEVIGKRGQGKQLATGVYQIGHFGSSHFLRAQGFQQIEYPDLWDDSKYIARFGVCDSYEDILTKFPKLVSDPDRQFVITVTRIDKCDEEPGGWRWHKWGEYIGKHTITTEYLYDEPIVEQVYCFHIYEKVK